MLDRERVITQVAVLLGAGLGVLIAAVVYERLSYQVAFFGAVDGGWLAAAVLAIVRGRLNLGGRSRTGTILTGTKARLVGLAIAAICLLAIAMCRPSPTF